MSDDLGEELGKYRKAKEARHTARDSDGNTLKRFVQEGAKYQK